MPLFRNRKIAGEKLADKLKVFKLPTNALVIALPRGGVIVAEEVSNILQLPLDVLIVRKLGLPQNPELAMGAISSEIRMIDWDMIRSYGVTKYQVDEIEAIERKELIRREKLYRANKPPLLMANKIVILVDDGAATGATMSVAIQTVRKQAAEKIIVALPVASIESTSLIATQADLLVVLKKPEPFFGVGMFYEEFAQVSDNEVCLALKKSKRTTEISEETEQESMRNASYDTASLISRKGAIQEDFFIT